MEGSCLIQQVMPDDFEKRSITGVVRIDENDPNSTPEAGDIVRGLLLGGDSSQFKRLLLTICNTCPLRKKCFPLLATCSTEDLGLTFNSYLFVPTQNNLI